MGFETILFLALGLTAILSAAMMVYIKNAVHSALFLIVNFGCVALLYLMLDAPFISMVQIAVYAGAIMVLFLFVIMLLGAEQATDAGGQFRWVTGAATVLAVVFVSVAVTMALIGLDLPESEGNDPLLRVVHSANLVDPVDITVTGDNLDEPFVIDGLIFADVSDFVTLTAGEYTVTFTDAGGVTLEDSITLENDDIITAIAYGDDATLGVLTTPIDLSPTSPSTARIQIVNLLDETVMLVDLGSNKQLDVDTGEINDRVIVEAIDFATTSETFDEREGTKTFAFYTQNGDELVSHVRLSDWLVAEGTEQLIIITADYGATTDSLGNYRPRVLDRSQESLTINAFEQFGSPKDIGNELFTTFLLPVNLVGFLLLVALIGVIVLTRPAGLRGERRATVNRRRKVSRPLVNVISQQTGRDVIEDVPRLQEPDSDE
ncbi:MAG: NADH-quinone oxidoreductase subunit J [Anaerolineae bacterium]|nr:NADH-quinone oxidoreductase subunit J [Anaerolineae bacterium]MDQ7035250.1 NADH-quinone oxidoreductase subunit J [Anaerolineae bacterium]